MCYQDLKLKDHPFLVHFHQVIAAKSGFLKAPAVPSSPFSLPALERRQPAGFILGNSFAESLQSWLRCGGQNSRRPGGERGEWKEMKPVPKYLQKMTRKGGEGKRSPAGAATSNHHSIIQLSLAASFSRDFSADSEQTDTFAGFRFHF